MKKDHIEKIEWAISFSQKDLKGLREGDWLNLKDELYEFLYGLGFRAHIGRKTSLDRILSEVKSIPKPQFITNTTSADVEEIKKVLSKCIQMLLHDTGVVFPLYIKEARIILGSMSPTSPFDLHIFVEDCLSAAKLNMSQYFYRSGITREQIRICPECDRRFLLKRKPRKDKTFYCSARCASTASTRAQRKREAERAMMKVTQLPGAAGGRSKEKAGG